MNNTLSQAVLSATKYLATPPLVQSYGRLVRVNGMTLTAVGGQFLMAKKYQVEGIDGAWNDAQVIGFDDSKAFLMLLNKADGLYAGARVRAVAESQMVKVDSSLLGRVIDAQMQPIDDLGALVKAPLGSDCILKKQASLNPLQRKGVSEPLDVGVRTINGLFTVGKGQRLGLFAGSGVGKSKLLAMMTRFTSADV